MPEAIARCQAFRAIVAASPVAEAWMINPLAVLHAMNGEFGLAEALLAEAHAVLDGLGGMTANVSHLEAIVRMLMGQPGRAETALRADVDALATMGRTDALATTTAMLAQAVLAQGRIDEAGELCGAAARATAPDDVFTEVIRRGVQASVLARQGACADAQELARSALEIIAATDLLTQHGDAMLRFTEVTHECMPASVQSQKESLRTALTLYEKKGNVTAAARARRSLKTSQGKASHGTEDQL
ncbi:MAG TPA: hypothetical protein VEX42_08980 [Microbacterium sp.]|nr:hypothetical protein [Microbacterium sp.]